MEKVNKKLIILYVYKILLEGSSEEKPVKQASILRILKSLHFECDRKTLATYVNTIKEFGEQTNSFQLIKIPGGGCYIKNYVK